jgi:hypothetical protein
MRFFFQFSWIFHSKIYTVIITVKTGTLVDFLHVQFTDSMPYWCHSKYVRGKEYTVFKLRLHITQNRIDLFIHQPHRIE